MSEMDPSKTRELYAEFIESMDREFQFWTTRFRNISVIIYLDPYFLLKCIIKYNHLLIIHFCKVYIFFIIGIFDETFI